MASLTFVTGTLVTTIGRVLKRFKENGLVHGGQKITPRHDEVENNEERGNNEGRGMRRSEEDGKWRSEENGTTIHHGYTVYYSGSLLYVVICATNIYLASFSLWNHQPSSTTAHSRERHSTNNSIIDMGSIISHRIAHQRSIQISKGKDYCMMHALSLSLSSLYIAEHACKFK